MATKREQELIKAFLYELARDYTPIGNINKILFENSKISDKLIYSDEMLERWASKATEDLLKGRIRWAK